MAMTTAFATALLNHYLNNANHANIGDATGLLASSAAGNVYVSLHTASPGATGDQTTNECAYTGYARVAVARTGSLWTVVGVNASNAAAVTFPQSSSGPESATHVGVGSASSGAGNLYLIGALDATLVINNLITPEFAIGELDLDAVNTI